MQRVTKYFWVYLPHLLFAGSCAFVGFVVLGCGMCENTILQKAISPDRHVKAVVFVHDCGATTGFSTRVSVIGAYRSLPNEGGNLLVVDTDNGVPPRGPSGGPSMSFEWLGNDLLVVRHHPAIRKYL